MRKERKNVENKKHTDIKLRSFCTNFVLVILCLVHCSCRVTFLTGRTFEGIRLNFETWVRETGGDRDKLKEYFNCQGPPLPIFPSVGLVSDFIPLSELHIMMGVTNKLVDCLIKVNIREYHYAYPKSELGGSLIKKQDVADIWSYPTKIRIILLGLASC